MTPEVPNKKLHARDEPKIARDSFVSLAARILIIDLRLVSSLCGRLFSNRVRTSHLFQFALVVADHRRRRRWGAGAAQSGSFLSQRPTCIETNIDFSQIYIARKSKTLKAKREILSETEDGILKFQKIEYQHIYT